MHEQHVLIVGRTRSDKIGRRRHPGGEQPVMSALVLFGRKNMGADGQVVVVAVDELERQHEALSIQHSAGRELKSPYHTRLPGIWKNVVRGCRTRFAVQEPKFDI